MSRPTKPIQTPGGHTVVVNTYITAREARALQVPYLKAAEELPKDQIDEKGLRATVFHTTQDLALKTVIVSFDGKKDGENGFDLLKTLLDELPQSETDFIADAINEITSDKEADEKKTK